MFNIYLSKEYCQYAKEILYRIGDNLDNYEVFMLYNVQRNELNISELKYNDYKIEIELYQQASVFDIVESLCINFTIKGFSYRKIIYIESFKMREIHNLIINDRLSYFNIDKYYLINYKNIQYDSWLSNRNISDQIQKHLTDEFKNYLLKRINHV